MDVVGLIAQMDKATLGVRLGQGRGGGGTKLVTL